MESIFIQLYSFINLKFSLHALARDDSQNMHVSVYVIIYVSDKNVLNLFFHNIYIL